MGRKKKYKNDAERQRAYYKHHKKKERLSCKKCGNPISDRSVTGLCFKCYHAELRGEEPEEISQEPSYPKHRTEKINELYMKNKTKIEKSTVKWLKDYEKKSYFLYLKAIKKLGLLLHTKYWKYDLESVQDMVHYWCHKWEYALSIRTNAVNVAMDKHEGLPIPVVEEMSVIIICEDVLQNTVKEEYSSFASKVYNLNNCSYKSYREHTSKHQTLLLKQFIIQIMEHAKNNRSLLELEVD